MRNTGPIIGLPLIHVAVQDSVENYLHNHFQTF